MSINEAIEVLRQAGYRVSKPRERRSNGTTKHWPPEKGQRYIGISPPSFKSHSVYRPRPLRPGGAPLPSDWAEQTAAIVWFMSQEARTNG